MQVDALTMQVDALTMQVDALTMQADALTMQADALTTQGIAKFKKAIALRIGLYLVRFPTNKCKVGMTGNLTGDRLYYALHNLIKKRLGLTKSPFASSYGKNTRSKGFLR
jgi:hypothetical protein